MQAEKPPDKRLLHNLRRLIDGARPLEKATMRHLARLLSVEELRPLDETLGRLDCHGKGGKDSG
jgi:hypothetical protein